MNRSQINKRSKQQEYKVRDMFRKYGWDAYRVPVSGAADILKGDVIADKLFMPDPLKLRFMVDNKSTDKKTIRISVETLDKIYLQTENLEIDAILIPGITITLPRMPIVVIVPDDLITSFSISIIGVVEKGSFTISEQDIESIKSGSKLLYIRQCIVQRWTIGRLDKILESLN